MNFKIMLLYSNRRGSDYQKLVEIRTVAIKTETTPLMA